MSEVAAYLVVLHTGLHPETVEATIAATRQLCGVAGISTIYDNVGEEIGTIRQIHQDLRAETLARARAAGI